MFPRYPIYVPSKGRFDSGYTAKFLLADGVPFKLVVEPQEAEDYTKRFGDDHVVVLPFSNLGKGSIPARNWIKEHATEAGFARHWQLDDNMQGVYRRYKRIRIRCDAGPALRAVEEFVDRYENIGVAGLNYTMFTKDESTVKPFQLNCHVYSCTLTLNSLPYSWRGRYNEDTDYCLQALAGGWCTALVNCFSVAKMQTMKLKGGNTDQLYDGDGRLRMSRSLERLWPGVVETRRRFGRPQHYVKWSKFDTPLKLRSDVSFDREPNEYGLDLVAIKEVESPELRRLVDEWRAIQSRAAVAQSFAATS